MEGSPPCCDGGRPKQEMETEGRHGYGTPAEPSLTVESQPYLFVLCVTFVSARSGMSQGVRTGNHRARNINWGSRRERVSWSRDRGHSTETWAGVYLLLQIFLPWSLYLFISCPLFSSTIKENKFFSQREDNSHLRKWIFVSSNQLKCHLHSRNAVQTSGQAWAWWYTPVVPPLWETEKIPGSSPGQLRDLSSTCLNIKIKETGDSA